MMKISYGILLSVLVTAVAQADPNDSDQCGQYNAYMGNLCDYDKDHDKKFTAVIPACSDCNSSSANLNDATKVLPDAKSKGSSPSGDPETAQ
jgi:hypothetical protein